jgi:hypothetical protein
MALLFLNRRKDLDFLTFEANGEKACGKQHSELLTAYLKTSRFRKTRLGERFRFIL